MNKNLSNLQSILLRIVLLTFISVFVCQCSTDEIPEPTKKPEPPEGGVPFVTKSAFDDSFDWDRLDLYPIYNPNLGRMEEVELPWAKGSTVAYGIPSEWLDENAYSSTFSERYYSRENHWVLVYSNLTKKMANKYFAIYNTRSGLLRFFFYALSNASGGGNTNSYWGIRIDKSSSLFNFTTNFAESLDKKKDSPSFITTPSGTLMGTQFLGKGYMVNNWYGIEVECAYDPSVVAGSMHNFEIMGWASNVATITGQGTTSGDIEGTIEFTAPSGGLNISLSNMFNKSNSEKNIVANQEGVADGLGEKIQEGINNNDSFFKGLWDNIKSKAIAGIGQGVKSGLKAILTSGGSLAVKALSGAVGSMLGIGGSKPTVGKVDLRLSANTEFTFESEQQLPGWGSITKVPVPGSTSNSIDMPLYNKPLGAWNLSKTPTIHIEGIAHDFFKTASTFYKGVYNIRYYADCSVNDIKLNDEIKNKVTIKNFNVQIAAEENNRYVFEHANMNSGFGYRYKPEAFGFMGNKKYYSKQLTGRPSGSTSMAALYGTTVQTNFPTHEEMKLIRPTELYHGIFKVVVSFDLVDNATGKVYSFSRWFNTKFGSQKINFRKLYLQNNQDYENYVSTIMDEIDPPTSGYDIIEEFDYTW